MLFPQLILVQELLLLRDHGRGRDHGRASELPSSQRVQPAYPCLQLGDPCRTHTFYTRGVKAQAPHTFYMCRGSADSSGGEIDVVVRTNVTFYVLELT